METQTVLLVEDDFLNRRLSKKILLENGYKILEAKNTHEAFEILKKEEVHIAVLDINLGENEQDGISLGNVLHDKYDVPFIYLTAYDTTDIVRKAVATAPNAFITKPFKNIDLITAVTLALRQISKHPRKPSILVKDREYNVELSIEEIDYVESEGNYLLFYTSNKVYKSRSTLKQVLEVLPPTIFIQTHRAYVVNKTKIEKFSLKSLIINNNVIPVSKNYIDDISMVYQ
jgi:DNA-binding LytR/AlgR family response regulator